MPEANDLMPISSNKNLDYFRENDSDKFNNPRNNPILNKYNKLEENIMTKALFYTKVFENAFSYPLKNILKNYNGEKFPAQHSTKLTYAIYMMVDNNKPSDGRLVDKKYGYISPINDNEQISFVAVPLVYTGDDPKNSVDFFNCDYEEKSDYNFRPLYNPKWVLMARNYPDMKFLEDEIDKKAMALARNMCFYSEEYRTFRRYTIRRAKYVGEVTAEDGFTKYKLDTLEKNINFYLDGKEFQPLSEKEKNTKLLKLAEEIDFSKYLRDESEESLRYAGTMLYIRQEAGKGLNYEFSDFPKSLLKENEKQM